MTYIVQYRVPEETLQTSIDEVMGVLGVDCLEARPMPDSADPDPGPGTGWIDLYQGPWSQWPSSQYVTPRETGR